MTGGLRWLGPAAKGRDPPSKWQGLGVWMGCCPLKEPLPASPGWSSGPQQPWGRSSEDWGIWNQGLLGPGAHIHPLDLGAMPEATLLSCRKCWPKPSGTS